MRLRFEHDTEVNALYIYRREIADGGIASTIELQDGVNLDVDEQGRTLGIEFVDADDFYPFRDRLGGELDIPERAADLKGLTPA